MPPLRIIAYVLLIALAGCSRKDPNLVVFDHDPQSVVELNSLLEDATKRGATRVCFPSGEWNWNCLGCMSAAAKNKPADLVLGVRPLDRKVLEEWLRENQVTHLEVGLIGNVPVPVFFEVEAMLRGSGIHYQTFIEQGAESSAPVIRMQEYAGPEVLPNSEKNEN